VLDVGATIERQFGEAGPGTSVDDFAAGQPPAGARDVPTEVAKDLEGKYITKKGVWKTIQKKKDDQTRIKNKDFNAWVGKKKAINRQLKDRGAEKKSINAQKERRLAQQQTIDNQMARRLRMKLGPEAPRPAAPTSEGVDQAPQIAPGEPSPAGNGPTLDE